MYLWNDLSNLFQHMSTIQTVKGVGKIKFYNDVVRRHVFDVPTSGVNSSLTIIIIINFFISNSSAVVIVII
jgi:hypothetical protein